MPYKIYVVQFCQDGRWCSFSRHVGFQDAVDAWTEMKLVVPKRKWRIVSRTAVEEVVKH